MVAASDPEEDDAKTNMAGSAAGALMRTSATFLIRNIPHIPAAKFFRPKAIKSQSIPKHGHLSHLLWHVGGGSVLFGVYSSVLQGFYSMNKEGERVSAWQTLVAGTASGVAHSALMSFVFNLHHSQHLPCHGREAMKNAWIETIKKPSFRKNFLRGFSTSLFSDALGFGLFFSTYEAVRQLLDKNYKNYAHDHHAYSVQKSTFSSAVHAAVAGCFAGLALELIHYPIHRAQHHHALAHQFHVPARLVPLGTVLGILRVHGVSFAYHNFVGFAARALPSSAMAFLAYELTLLWVRNYADLEKSL